MNTELVPAGLREQWTAPLDRECLACYLGRMLADFGCDNTLRWSIRWRDACAPRAMALARRGGHCDCAVASVRRPPDEAGPPQPCAGVRRGSTRPCRPKRRPPPPA
jgi:hypothetical protein